MKVDAVDGGGVEPSGREQPRKVLVEVLAWEGRDLGGGLRQIWEWRKVKEKKKKDTEMEGKKDKKKKRNKKEGS